MRRTVRSPASETPLPGGTDTQLLGFLTSVGDWEHGRGAPPTVERLVMRLRILWFFFMAIPILVGATVLAGLAAMVVASVTGTDSNGDALVTAVGLTTFVAGIVFLVWLFARWFDRLIRGYRARLIDRARAETAGRQAAARGTPSISEIDATLAPHARDRPAHH